MFGYVIPDKGKLTDSQWSTYRSAYCGLCATLSQRHGFLAQFLLNYDFTLLALLLRSAQNECNTYCRHCVAHPIRGRSACESDAGLDAAADCSVLLVYWKLRDQLADEKGLQRLAARGLLLLYRRVFRRARNNAPELDRAIGSLLAQLGDLEQEHCPSLDRTADCFARIMTAMVPSDWTECRRRELQQLLYHLGRWIYLVDALDDLEEDLRQGKYNPLACRFKLSATSDSKVLNEAKEQVNLTMAHSENLAIAAFHLGDYSCDGPIIENILCAGLSGVRQLVLSGQWRQLHRKKKQELKRL